MKSFKSDLHIHSLLSPCGELEMSPAMIIEKAKAEKLDIIGITDHNSTRQAFTIQKMAEKEGIYVLMGAEVTSKEEVHCLCYFPDEMALNDFQDYLDMKLPNIKNDPVAFGDQVAVNENEEIVFEESRLLISAIDDSMENIAKKTASLNGLFVPAHIDKASFSLISQLGFIPLDLEADAVEISKHTTKEKILSSAPYISSFSFLRSSDAHQLDILGTEYSVLHMKEVSFEEIKKAFRQIDGRYISLTH